MTRHGLPSPPWFATGTPLPFRVELPPVDFGGQNAEAPPYPPSLVPFRFGSVSRFRYRFALPGLCTVELFAIRFFGGYPVLSDRLGMSPSSRLPAAADVERKRAVNPMVPDLV